MNPRLVMELMTPHPKTLDAGASVADALQLLEEAHCHHVPVVHHDRLIGMLSERDLLVRMPPPPQAGGSAEQQGAFGRHSIHALMTREPPTVLMWQPASAAVAIILGEGVTAVPVVDDCGLLVGIITISDVARLCLELLDADLSPLDEGGAKSAATEVVVVLDGSGMALAP